MKIIKYLKKLLNNQNLYLSISRKCFQMMEVPRTKNSYNSTKFVCDRILDM